MAAAAGAAAFGAGGAGAAGLDGGGEHGAGPALVRGAGEEAWMTRLNLMHDGFRQALTISAAEQRASVEALIVHARVKFLELEVKLDVLNASAAHAQSVTEQWALGEGARTATQIASASGLRIPPGGNLASSAASGSPPASPRDPFTGADPWLSASGPARPQRGAAAF